VTSERKLRWIVRLGSIAIRLLGATWRIRLVNDAGTVVAARRAKQPVVFTLWHGEMLPLLYHHRDQGVAVLISDHRDGEMIARIAERFGFGTVRGSTSKGASRALVGLARALEAGHDVAITPDGPRGPARSFAPGALVAAQRVGAPVLPVVATATRAWRLRSWDRFLIPKPFSRVTIAYGDLTRMNVESAREAAVETERFQLLMADTAKRADG
jgi:lysophospholipid acyltransferase (LPLAT)-like uncharacterized protein